MTVPARIFTFTARHYIASSVSVLAVVAMALLLLLPIRRSPVDKNLSYARAKEEFLVAYNKEGEELWRKHISQRYDEHNTSRDDDTYLTTISLNNDGHNDVIGIFGDFGTRTPLDNIIQCYNEEGGERWKFAYHRTLACGKEKFSDDYLFSLIAAGNFAGDGNPLVVAVSRHDLNWPASVVVLDARNGTLLGEYWHSGWINSIEHCDLDGDGKEEVIFFGENNSYSRPAVIVLDPRHVKGHGPATDQFVPQDVEPGTEKYYILLPYSDLMDDKAVRYPYPTLLTLRGDGTVEAKVQEDYEGLRAELMFSFGSSMRCIKVRPTDDFVRLHKKMEAEGKSAVSVDDAYLEKLRKAVQYWDGDRFVQECKINRRYLETLQISVRP